MALLRFRVRGTPGEFRLSPEASVTELGRSAARAGNYSLPLPPGRSLVMALDPERWVQVECPQEFPLQRWLGEEVREEPIEVELCEAERCQHGSPAVPGRGYACGWC